MFLYFLVILCFISPSLIAQAQQENDSLIHSAFKQEEGLVIKVVSTDTFVLEDGRRIRLLGVESFGPPPRPVVKFDSKGRPIEEDKVEPTIPLEEQAIVFARSLMEGKRVKLEYDVDSRDDQGFKVAYVYLPDGRMVNVELLRQGFVRLKIRPPNVKHEDLLKSAYQEARKQQRGFLSD